MTTGKTRLVSAEELLRLPRGDGKRYELIRGVLVEKMPTGDPHADTVTRTSNLIFTYSEDTNFGVVRSGEPGFRLGRNPDTVRAPDVAWIAPGRIEEGTQGFPELAPDLAVEVKSPSNTTAEMTSKAEMWLSNGSLQTWVVNPENTTVTIHRPYAEPVSLSEDEVLEGGELLPGFSVEVWRLFRRQR